MWPSTGLHRPFKKATSNPIYVHKDSNHPMHVKKELPQMIGRRISDLSSNKDVFETEVQASGYNNELHYTEKTIAKKRSRRRNVIWFNLPWNDEVSTNVAKKFLNMIDRHFPQGSALGKHFNRSTVTVINSSMPNRIISGHNKKVTESSIHLETKGCNCRSQPCPLELKCRTTILVYRRVHQTNLKHLQEEVHWTLDSILVSILGTWWLNSILVSILGTWWLSILGTWLLNILLVSRGAQHSTKLKYSRNLVKQIVSLVEYS